MRSTPRTSPPPPSAPTRGLQGLFLSPPLVQPTAMETPAPPLPPPLLPTLSSPQTLDTAPLRNFYGHTTHRAVVTADLSVPA